MVFVAAAALLLLVVALRGRAVLPGLVALAGFGFAWTPYAAAAAALTAVGATLFVLGRFQWILLGRSE